MSIVLPRKAVRELDDLEAVGRHTVGLLQELDIEHGEVSVSRGEALELGVRDGKVELLKDARSSGLSLRVLHRDRVGVSSTNDLDPDALREFIVRTAEMASISEPDPLAAPPDASELCLRPSRRDIEAYDPATLRVSVAKAEKLARAAERASTRDKRISASEGASFTRSAAHSVLVTSGGFVGRSSGTYQGIVAQVIADDRDQRKSNGAYASGSRFLADLESPAAVGREAARRAIAALNSKPMATGRYPVVFERDAAADLVTMMASCLVGDAVFRDQSYLAKRLGTRVASDLVTLVDDPFLVRGLGSRLFDGEGRRTKKLSLVERGVLRGFLLDTYSARKLKMEPTGSAAGGGGIPHPSASNLYLEPGRRKPESLLAGIEKGLYVTQMMGFGFDAVTGKFSRGAIGFAIENGALSHPVSEVTISRNVDELFQGIDMVANDLDHHGSIASPSFRVDQMTVSGAMG